MMSQAEFPERFGEFNEDPGRYKPSYHRDELPEYPMFGSFGQLLHHPGVIEGYIGLPRGCAGRPEQRGQTEGRKKNQQCTYEVNNENMLNGHACFFGTQNYYKYLSIKILKNESFVK
jgi:hypothetical protein